ncbi:MAG TPA: FkbM family methyltransferase [Thermoanaerobaculia bacterium]
MSQFMSDLASYMQACSAAFNARSLETLYAYTNTPDVIAERDRSWIKRKWLAMAVRLGARRLVFDRDEMQQITSWGSGLDDTYRLLADDHSRRILIEVMAYRLLGPAKVKLSRNDEQYRRFFDAIPVIARQRQTVKINLLGGWLDRYDLDRLGYPIEADLHHLNILYTFQLEQYRYDRDGVVVEARPGDIAIDGGGCWGDTALYLAQRVGPTGHVHSFEPSPDNLPVFEANLQRNAELASRISVHRNALWKVSDAELSFDPKGPATSVGGTGAATVRSLAIDDLIERKSVPRVGFIKMDIEGAELDALRGAERTIRAQRPRLAVTLYHRLGDFVTIPRFLNELELGYRLYIDHFSIKREETVLFAIVD